MEFEYIPTNYQNDSEYYSDANREVVKQNIAKSETANDIPILSFQKHVPYVASVIC